MKNWRRCHLGDALTLQRGFDLPERDRSVGDVPIISSSGVTGFHDEAKVKAPGVVTGRYGTLGEVHYVTKDFWPLNTTLYVKDFKGNRPLFLSYFLKTLNFSSQNSAGAVPGVNRNHLHMLSICIPPVPIQHKIAAILSAYDDLIENNTRRIAILETMAQAIYREWFVEFRFPGHEKVRLVDSPLGKIPQGWKPVRVDESIFVNPRTAVPREDEKPFVSMGAVPHNTMLIDVAATEMREGNSGSKFKNDDTLFARITPCLENGKTAFVQFLPSSEAVAFGSTEFIVLRSKTVCPEFVYLLARSAAFRDNAIKSMSGATGRQRVQEKCFDNFYFPHPDPATISAFSEFMNPLFKNVFALSRKNHSLRNTRDLLLPKLISGEVNVEDIDIETGQTLAEAEA